MMSPGELRRLLESVCSDRMDVGHGAVAYTIHVDVKLSAEFLRNNVRREGADGDGNRKVRPAHVSKLSDLMKRGLFMPNYDPVIFDVDGYMINAQHRLISIENTGRAQTMIVIWNAPKDVWDGLDQGSIRSVADVLQRPTDVTAVASVIMHVATGSTSMRRAAPIDIARWLVDYQEGIEFACQLFNKRARKGFLRAAFAMARVNHPEHTNQIAELGREVNDLLNMGGNQAGEAAQVIARAINRTSRIGQVRRANLCRAIGASIRDHCQNASRQLLRVGISDGSSWLAGAQA